MSAFFDKDPDGIQRAGDSHVFYYGVNPNELRKYTIGHQFTAVFKGINTRPWRSVRFRIVPSTKTDEGDQYAKLDERVLTPEEIGYFEELIQSTGG